MSGWQSKEESGKKSKKDNVYKGRQGRRITAKVKGPRKRQELFINQLKTIFLKRFTFSFSTYIICCSIRRLTAPHTRPNSIVYASSHRNVPLHQLVETCNLITSSLDVLFCWSAVFCFVCVIYTEGRRFCLLIFPCVILIYFTQLVLCVVFFLITQSLASRWITILYVSISDSIIYDLNF